MRGYIHPLKRRIALLLISAFSFSVLWGQNQAELMRKAKVGTFYYYPKDSKNFYRITRNGSIQEEIDPVTRDTTIWRILWINDSISSMRYLSGSRKLTDAQRAFRNVHSVVSRINRVTAEYYTFS